MLVDAADLGAVGVDAGDREVDGVAGGLDEGEVGAPQAAGLEAVLVEADDVGRVTEADGEVGRDAGEELAGGSLALVHDGHVGIVAAPGDHDGDVGDDAESAEGVVGPEVVEDDVGQVAGLARGDGDASHRGVGVALVAQEQEDVDRGGLSGGGVEDPDIAAPPRLDTV